MITRHLETPAGCVVGGGRSSRMGKDKGAICFAGESLLERALSLLGTASDPVFVAGSAGGVPPGTELVQDAIPGCGPMGGVTAGLRFAAGLGVHWVLFLPVDMPLLPSGLLRLLVARWREAVQAGAWVCCVEADGRVQPLVSIAHTAVLPGLEWALSAGQYRLRPAFESAAEVLARVHGTDPEAAFCRTPVEELNLKAMTLSAAEWRRRELWFSNVNTPKELAMAVGALAAE